MATLGTAYVQIVPSMDGVAKKITSGFSGIDLSGTGAKMGSSMGSACSSGFSGKFAAVAGVVAGIAQQATASAVGAINAAMGDAVARVDTLNNFPKIMSNLGYSADDAAASISKISDSLIGLPTTTDSVASLVQQLAPLTSNLDEATDIGLAFNNMCLASGKGLGDQSRAMLQFTQMLSTGRVDMMSWRTLQEVMPGQLDQMAQSLLGASARGMDLYSALQDGTITFQDFNDAMLDLNENGINGFASFSQQAKDATTGISTAFTNLRTAIVRSLANVIQAFGATNISGFINDIGAGISSLGKKLIPFATVAGQAFAASYSAIKSFYAGIQSGKGVLDALVASLEPFSSNVIVNSIIGFVKAIQSGTPILEAFKNQITQITSGDAFGNFIQGIKDKISTLPAPLQAVIGKFVEFGTKIANAIGSMNGEGTVVIAGFIGVLTLLHSPLTAISSSLVGFFKIFSGAPTVLAGFTQALSRISPLFTGLNKAFSMAGGGLGGFKAALGMIASPVGIVVAAIAALVAAFVYLFTTNEQFRNTVMDLVAVIGASLAPIIQVIGDAISNLAATCLPLITNAIDMLLPVIGQIITLVLQIAAALAPVITTIVSTVVPILTTIIELVVTVATEILAAVLPVISMILGAIQSAMPLIQSIITTVMAVIQEIIQTVWPIVQQIIEMVVQNVVTFIQMAMPLIEQIFSTVMTVIQTLVETVWPVIQQIITTVMGVVQGVIQAVWPLIQTIITTAMTIIQDVINVVMAAINGDWSGVWNGIKQLASDIWNGIKNIIDAAINAVKGVVESVMNGIKGLWESIWGGISSFVSSTWESVKSAVSDGVNNVINFIQDMPNKIKGFFSDAGDWLLSAGRDVIQGLINGISDAAGWLWDKISGMGSELVNKAKSALGIGSPSKLMREQVGRWLPAGIGVGIEKYSSYATDAMSNLAGDIMSTSEGIEQAMPFSDGGLNANVSAFGRSQVEMRSDSTVADILDAINEYLPSMAQEKQVVMDTGVLAGVLTKPMNKNLGSLQRRGAGALC